jgi:hypothetical protein
MAFLVDQHFDNASVLEYLDESLARAVDLRKVRATPPNHRNIADQHTYNLFVFLIRS